MKDSKYYDKPKHGFKSENHARRWAKNRKLKVKCIFYEKGGARVMVANRRKCLTLRVDDLHSDNAKTTPLEDLERIQEAIQAKRMTNAS